ncbi:importin alpha [Anaeramoeba flamelloides]|uniref:Importin subunit alpha n=1 Tax=Anaeramoeba flamelloides TaxID=1746091 RepID=A0ABQ8Z8W2_9EUKA|nr:importin alpha [Anaeramoeba flamelloides]
MSFEKKLTQRRKKFKNTATRVSSRDKRLEITVKISKDKRESRLMKRRNLVHVNQKIENKSVTTQEEIPPIEDLPIFAELVKSKQIDECYRGTRAIKLLLSEETDPPIDLVINTNVAPYFNEFLSLDNYPDLQFESTWALSNLCSENTTQTKYIVDLGVIPKLVRLISSPDIRVCEQAMWALGNIAGDNTQFRDQILQQKKLFEQISQIFLRNDLTNDVAKTASWALSNFVDGKPRPEFELVKDSVPIFKMLLNENLIFLVVDACWGFSKLCLGNKKIIDVILENNILDIFVNYLSSTNVSLKHPSLRIIGSMLSGNHLQTEKVLQFGVLEPLKDLLNDTLIEIRRAALFAISNITAGNQEQVNRVLTCGIIPILMDLFEHDINPIKKEVCWVISNAIFSGFEDQLRFLIKEGVVDFFGEALTLPYVDVIIISLDSITKLLRLGKIDAERSNRSYNNVAKKLIEINASELIDKLQIHENEKIKLKAKSIMDRYFFNQEDVEEYIGKNNKNYEF